jgi:hypothetical protein
LSGGAGPAPTTGAAGGRRASLLIAVAGSMHALLFLLAYWLVSSTPGTQATDQELVSFYASDDRRRLIVVGLYVMPFAGIAFLWFSVALRAAIHARRQRVSELLAGMQLASGILYVGLFFVAAAAISVMAVSMDFVQSRVDPVVARELPQYGRALLVVFAMRMAAIFVFTTSRLGRVTGVLPRWLVGVSFVVGLFLLLSSSFSRALVLVFPGWLLLLCATVMLGPAPPPVAAGDAAATAW